MSNDRIIQGISLCEEILNAIENNESNLQGLLRKTMRFAALLQKEDEFSWVIKELEIIRDPPVAWHGMIPKGTHDWLIGIIHDEITKQWLELRFGGVIERIFEENKKLVDSKVVEICPDAVEMFESAYERLKETNPESWAEGVLTCRRILKDFADAIYPPTNKIINGHELDEEQYINRLWEFASEKIEKGTNRELIKGDVKYIGNIIDTLYDLTCKGTHSKITKDEAERAIIRTYLLIGDLIKLGGL